MKKRAEAEEAQDSRRSFLKAVAYVAPVIVSLQAAPSFAAVGSQQTAPRRLPRDPRPPRQPRRS
jgi:hypothetical protein